MPRANLLKVDAKVAHYTFDNVGTQAVIGCQRIALLGRQIAAADLRAIGSDRGVILDVTLVKPPNGACAEADQDITCVGGITLKIPVKVPRRLRRR